MKTLLGLIALFLSVTAMGADPAISHMGMLSGRVVWNSGVHRIDGDLEVSKGAELTIRSPARIEVAEGKALLVAGALRIEGSQAHRVEFVAASERWLGLQLMPGAKVDMRGFRITGATIAIGGEGANVDLSLCGISGSFLSNIDLRRSWLKVTDCYVTDAGENGIAAERSYVDISGSKIVNNGSFGISLSEDSEGEPPRRCLIEGNRFPLRVPFASVPEENDKNKIRRNSNNVLFISGGRLNSSLRLTAVSSEKVENELRTFVVERPIVVDSNGRLKIAPGVILRFLPDAGLEVNGRLRAIGSANAPIMLTSLEDIGWSRQDSWVVLKQQRGPWRGVTIASGGSRRSSVLEQVKLRYGGTDGAMLRVLRSRVELHDVELFASSASGVLAENSKVELWGSEILASVGSALKVVGNRSKLVVSDLTSAFNGSTLESISARKIEWKGATSFDETAVDGFASDTRQTAVEVVRTGTVFAERRSQRMGAPGVPRLIATRVSGQSLQLEFGELASYYDYRLLVRYSANVSSEERALFRVNQGAWRPVSIGATGDDFRWLEPLDSGSFADGKVVLEFKGTIPDRVMLLGARRAANFPGPTTTVSVRTLANARGNMRLVEVSGTTNDPNSAGVAKVDLILVGQSNELEWFQVPELGLHRQWRINLALPAQGKFGIKARAVDWLGNVGPESEPICCF